MGQPESESPTLTYAVDYPSEGEWRRSDRTVRCFAIAKDGAPALTGSVRDIARAAPASAAQPTLRTPTCTWLKWPATFHSTWNR